MSEYSPPPRLDLYLSVTAPVAQRIEHLTTDQKVRGSNPLGRAAICLTHPQKKSLQKFVYEKLYFRTTHRRYFDISGTTILITCEFTDFGWLQLHYQKVRPRFRR
jgi:hypothetical protein